MGQESSSPIDETMPPSQLESRTVDGLAAHIKAGKAKRIVVMTGAGISTSAGIPDFRSPGTGLYHNLARLNLPYPEAVFELGFFKKNPAPFYVLAGELYPGKFRPTLTHAFIALLADKGLLLKCFTQNIDTLERIAGVPADLIVEAHGSFASQRCVECKLEFPEDEMREHVTAQTIPHCSVCKGLVKPDIVFFGEALPPRFFTESQCVRDADLAIVMGSSLTVYPFAGLPQAVRSDVPRFLINKERVGGIGGRPDDVLELGECDEGVRKLAKACGWEKDLMRKWESTNPKKWDEEEWAKKWEAAEEKTEHKNPDEDIEARFDALTKESDQTLKIADEHKTDVHNETGKSKESMPMRRRMTAPSIFDSKIVGAEDGEGLGHIFPHLKGKEKPTL
jgi:NAD-dependent histone deacetylase SIR2